MTLAYGIDPSTNTGIVGLDEQGNVIEQVELVLDKGIDATPKEIWDYASKIVGLIPEASVIAIEAFSFGSKGQAVSTQYGIGFAIRFQLLHKGFKIHEPTPTQVKKFATGKGAVDKANMVLPIFKKWSFEHESDNVRDAFVLAQIARSVQSGITNTKYEEEVLKAILEGPRPKTKKKRS
ncbi:hypothetical protein [Paenibacillus illinoisensis]|uniref:hypothetical protein n=1 Tax=Paenibacillus illinoisensis TaxID=59845 RepID=UPI00203B1A92|nr:hypothetical protein [Paenibacillus illinoisensis]MCM3208519.1 hypothetical protein [Paenibacillus illinoisensis]